MTNDTIRKFIEKEADVVVRKSTHICEGTHECYLDAYRKDAPFKIVGRKRDEAKGRKRC